VSMLPEGIWAFALLSFTSLFAITNPLVAAPLFMAITEGHTPQEKLRTLRLAVTTGAVVLVTFALLGGAIFQFLGVTIHAFRIAGGIIIFGMAAEMLQAKPSRLKSTSEEEAEALVKSQVGITPLGVPMIVGPGAITTVMVLAGDAPGFFHVVSLFGAMALVLGSIYLVLRAAPWITELLGQTGVNVLTRIMGLLLAVVAVQFVIDGVQAVLGPMLAGSG
jgi:multiple antibiotic resistance protein